MLPLLIIGSAIQIKTNNYTCTDSLSLGKTMPVKSDALSPGYTNLFNHCQAKFVCHDRLCIFILSVITHYWLVYNNSLIFIWNSLHFYEHISVLPNVNIGFCKLWLFHNFLQVFVHSVTYQDQHVQNYLKRKCYLCTFQKRCANHTAILDLQMNMTKLWTKFMYRYLKGKK